MASWVTGSDANDARRGNRSRAEFADQRTHPGLARRLRSNLAIFGRIQREAVLACASSYVRALATRKRRDRSQLIDGGAAPTECRGRHTFAAMDLGFQDKVV